MFIFRFKSNVNDKNRQFTVKFKVETLVNSNQQFVRFEFEIIKSNASSLIIIQSFFSVIINDFMSFVRESIDFKIDRQIDLLKNEFRDMLKKQFIDMIKMLKFEIDNVIANVFVNAFINAFINVFINVIIMTSFISFIASKFSKFEKVEYFDFDYKQKKIISLSNRVFTILLLVLTNTYIISKFMFS